MIDTLEFGDVFEGWEKSFLRISKVGGTRDYANGGKWVPSFGDPVEMQGVILPLSNQDLQFDPGGAYTRDDRKVYVRHPGVLAIDDRVKIDGLEYRVLEERPYTDYADFNLYIVKRVDTKGRDPVA